MTKKKIAQNSSRKYYLALSITYSDQYRSLLRKSKKRLCQLQKFKSCNLQLHELQTKKASPQHGHY